MRLVYSSDLHGYLPFYRQLLEFAVAQQATIAIVGGDLLPHATQRATALEHQRRFIHDELVPLLHEYKARHPALTLYVIPGNDDWAAAYATMTTLEQEHLLINIHHRAAQLGDELWINGSGLVGITPFAIKDYERRDTSDAPPVRFAQGYRSERGTIEPFDSAELLDRPTLTDDLDQLTRQSDPQRTIYVFHCPPWQTMLDRRTGGAAIGSRAIRNFIERYQPPLTLHGHVHESPTVSGAWLEQISNTVAINPGQAQRGFHAVALDTDNIVGTAQHTVYDRPSPAAENEKRH